MRKLSNISLLASASVLALTTAVYTPAGFVSAADEESSTACVSIADNTINDTRVGNLAPTNDTKGAIISGECEYKIGTLSNKYLVIASGAKVTLDIADANINYVDGTDHTAAIVVAAGGELTLTGKPGTSAATEFIQTSGTLNIADTDLTNITGSIAITGGTTNIETSRVNSVITVSGGSQLNITSGTFSKLISSTNGTINATGGEYLKSVFTDTATVTGLIAQANRENYKAYIDTTDASATNIYIEPTLVASNINFTMPEALIEDAGSNITDATYENSATGFTYEVGTVDEDGAFTAAALNTDYTLAQATDEEGPIDNTQTLTVVNSGTYAMKVATTFDPTIYALYNFDVNSTLDSVSIKQTAAIAGVTDGTGDNGEDDVYGGTNNTLNLFAGDKVAFDFQSAVAEDVTGTASVSGYKIVLDDESGLVSLSGKTGDDSTATSIPTAGDAFVITVNDQGKTGSTSATVTAIATDGTEKSFTLKINVNDVIAQADVEGKTTVAALGQSVKIKDLVSFINEEKEQDASAYTYTASIATGSAAYGGAAPADDDEGDLSITPTAALNTGAGKTTISITVKDGADNTATVTATVYVISDFTINYTDEESTPVTGDLVVAEDNDSGTTVQMIVSSPNGIPDEVLASSGPVYTVATGTVDDEGVFTEYTDDDYKLINLATGDGVATLKITANTIQESDTAAVLVKLGSIEKLVNVKVQPQLASISILDSAQNVLGTASIDGDATVTATAVQLIQDDVNSYAITQTSENAKFSYFVESSSEDVVAVNNEDGTFSLTGKNITSSAATVTVTAVGSNGETLAVNIPATVIANPDPTIDAPAVSGIYTIVSSLSSDRALDVNGASVDSGANIQLWRNNGTIAQKFIFTANSEGYYTIENLKSGKLLTADSTNVIQQTAATSEAGKNAQLWQIVKSGDYYMFVSKASGLALDVSRGSTDQGTNIQVYANNGEKSQLFSLSSTAAFEGNQAVPTGTKTTIISVLGNGDRALDILGAGTGNGANLQLWRANDSVAQNFTFELLDNGFYKIYTDTGDGKKVLDVSGAGTAQGTNVDQWRDNGTIAQQWLVRQNSDGTYTITSRCNGLALDLQGGGSALGTNVQLWRDNGTDAQKFFLPGIVASTPSTEE